jgi:NitT/TauT family transport system ATP-binding protein
VIARGPEGPWSPLWLTACRQAARCVPPFFRHLATWPEVSRILDAIELHGIKRSFDIAGARLPVLDGVDLRVSEREIVSVVGPNGCGKSTLLRVISGLLPPDSGSVLAFDSTVAGPEPRIGLVFQEPRLLPWRDVLGNVAFPLELGGVDRSTREHRAQDVLRLTGMEGFAAAYPDQLSGGMAQRVALARALAPEPDILLLDEPFSALDAMTRERLDMELLAVWGMTGTTIVLVTHSISEAVLLSDRVLVMSARPGRIVDEVPVDAPRPRSLGGPSATAYGDAADKVRSLLGATATA